MERSTAIAEPDAETEAETEAAPSLTTLRLIRGTSERSEWSFRPSDVGVSVTLGASPTCDWPVATGGLEDCELTLLFAGGTLLAKREHDNRRVRVDGSPLGEGWTFVKPGSRIEVGLACLEVALDAESTSPCADPPDTLSDTESDPPSIIIHSVLDILPPTWPPPPPAREERGSASEQGAAARPPTPPARAKLASRKLPPPPPPPPTRSIVVPPPAARSASARPPAARTAMALSRAYMQSLVWDVEDQDIALGAPRPALPGSPQLRQRRALAAWQTLSEVLAEPRVKTLTRLLLMLCLALLYGGWLQLLDAL